MYLWQRQFNKSQMKILKLIQFLACLLQTLYLYPIYLSNIYNVLVLWFVINFNLIVVCYRLSCQNLVQINLSIVSEAFTFLGSLLKWSTLFKVYSSQYWNHVCRPHLIFLLCYPEMFWIVHNKNGTVIKNRIFYKLLSLLVLTLIPELIECREWHKADQMWPLLG